MMSETKEKEKTLHSGKKLSLRKGGKDSVERGNMILNQPQKNPLEMGENMQKVIALISL